jgi:hypothetical protein
MVKKNFKQGPGYTVDTVDTNCSVRWESNDKPHLEETTEQWDTETKIVCIEEPDGTKRWLKGQLHREDGPAIEMANGAKGWYRNGLLHREDGPSIELADGTKGWHRNGKLHREDGPAEEYADGDKVWWINGERHREDGPAIERSNGTKFWHKHGQLHREDGPAIEWLGGRKEWYLDSKVYTEEAWEKEKAKQNIEQNPERTLDADGTIRWKLNGELHREDGPALKFIDGTEFWYRHGLLHREDGPALEYADGTKKWYLEGIEYSEKDWIKITKPKIQFYIKCVIGYITAEPSYDTYSYHDEKNNREVHVFSCTSTQPVVNMYVESNDLVLAQRNRKYNRVKRFAIPSSCDLDPEFVIEYINAMLSTRMDLPIDVH